jgi:hypothetical protein
MRLGNPDLAAKSGKVLKRFDAWKKEVGTALYGRESWQALYFLRIGRFGTAKSNVPS